MRLLVFFAHRPGEVVPRAEILEEVWEGRAVVDETLSRAMSLVRQALGDNAQKPTYFETIPKRGYRLIAAVRPADAKAPGVGISGAGISGAGISELEVAPSGALERGAPERGASKTGASEPGNGESRAVAGVAPNPGSAGTFAPEGASGSSAAGPKRWRSWGLLGILTVLAVLAWVGWMRKSSESSSRPVDAAASRSPEPSRRPGIAVLPFQNLSPDPANAYLADGLTEELTHQLAGVSGLRVVSRTSATHFRDSDALAPEIADTLKVDYLLEGTVLVVGQRLRITAQLIHPDRDDHLLSRSYDRDLSEVLDVQREVAKDVAEQTRTELSPKEALRLGPGRPVRSEAYRAYLQGHQEIQRRSDIRHGLELLERSVDLDPDFAPAWAALADAHLLANSYTVLSEGEAYSGAEVAIARALELDPDLPAAHASLGLLRLQRDRDWAGSEASYRRAISLERSYVTARQWYSELLSFLGRHQEACEQVTIALELDPLSPLIHAAAGQRFNAAGRYEEALRRLEDVDALGPGFSWHLREKSWALARLGRESESLQLSVEDVKHRKRASAERIADLERAVAEEGMIGYHRWNLQGLLTMSRRPPGYSTWLATAYAGSGQTEKALEWLAVAAQKRNLWLLHTLKSPAFDSLREDPRFTQALGDLPPWRVEAGG